MMAAKSEINWGGNPGIEYLYQSYTRQNYFRVNVLGV